MGAINCHICGKAADGHAHTFVTQMGAQSQPSSGEQWSIRLKEEETKTVLILEHPTKGFAVFPVDKDGTRAVVLREFVKSQPPAAKETL